MDITEDPAYEDGIVWTTRHVDRLRELFSERELDTAELRVRLFEEAARRYPSRPGDMENDLRQTAWVAGALKPLADLMPFSPEGLAAVFDAALEMGMIYSAEAGKAEALEELKGKPRGWWQRKVGDARPNDVVMALSNAWWRDHRGAKKGPGRFGILIDRLGTREMRALATLERITHVASGTYRYYDVDGKNVGFQVVSDPVFEGGRLVQGAGDIVG